MHIRILKEKRRGVEREGCLQLSTESAAKPLYVTNLETYNILHKGVFLIWIHSIIHGWAVTKKHGATIKGEGEEGKHMNSRV